MPGKVLIKRICPGNRAYFKWIEKNETFSEEETQLLRAGLTEDALPGAIREKLDRMGLIRFFGLKKCLEMFSRKLTILL